MIDATVIPTPLARALDGLAWVFSSQERRPVSGLARVLRVWTAGTRRVSLGGRLWRQGGPSKDALALEVLSEARHRLRCRPDCVRFDAWSPSRRRLPRLRDEGWSFVCRRKQNRRCNGQAGRAYRRHPSGAEGGWRTGGLQVLVVRDGATSDATKRRTRPAAEGRRWSRVRAHSAAVIRVGTAHLGLRGGHARAARVPRQHLTCGLVACWGLARARYDRHLTSYTRKRHLSDRGRTVGLPALERFRKAA